MKHKFLYSLVFLAFFGVGCNGTTAGPDPGSGPVSPSLTLDGDEVALSPAGGDSKLSLSSNVAWKVVGANDWCQVLPASGEANANQSITIRLLPNASYDERRASLTFMPATGVAASGSTKVIAVAQPGRDGLILATRDTTLVRRSSTLTVKLLSNVDYAIADDATWIEIIAPASKALVPSSVNFAVDENPTTAERIAKITFTDKKSALRDEIIVRQSANGAVQTFEARAWDGVRRADAFYEIFVRSFADSDGDGTGDLNGITAKLDYLAGLGVTGLWLTPINPSPSYHGYDVTDYKAVNPEFGTMADFKRLVSAARSRGIRIVLDFVINHSSDQHPWFVAAKKSETAPERNFYTFAKKADVQNLCQTGAVAMVDDNKYNSSWWRDVVGAENTTDYKYYGMFSHVMPDFNYGHVPELNPIYDSLLSAAGFWMEQGVAGLRLDAVKHIYQDEWGQENVKFLRRFYDDLRAEYPGIYMIGEVLGSTDQSAMFLGGLPSVFHFDSWWKLDDAIAKGQGRYYARDMQDAINKFRSVSASYNVGTKLSNHDEDRAMSKLGRNGDKARVAFAAIMTTPGQPYLYYGEEIGMFGMKTTDENVREPLLWGDSFTPTKFPKSNNSTEQTVDNIAKQSADPASLLNFYREFLRLRNTYEPLAKGSLSYPDPESVPRELMVFDRTSGGGSVRVIINVSGQEVEYSFVGPVTRGVKAHNGARLLKFTDGSYVAEMKPYSIIVLEK